MACLTTLVTGEGIHCSLSVSFNDHVGVDLEVLGTRCLI